MSPNENRKMEQTLSHKIIKFERHRNCYLQGMKNPLLEFVLKLANVVAQPVEDVEIVGSEKLAEDVNRDLVVDAEIV